MPVNAMDLHPSEPPTEEVPSSPTDLLGGPAAVHPPDVQLVVEEVLVEEISIDGMCGVY
jgi:mycofactocin precursor